MPQAFFIGVSIKRIDPGKGFLGYEIIESVVDLIPFKGCFLTVPHGKGLKFPPVIQMIQCVFDIRER
jgi:hypothetical protein